MNLFSYIKNKNVENNKIQNKVKMLNQKMSDLLTSVRTVEDISQGETLVYHFSRNSLREKHYHLVEGEKSGICVAGGKGESIKIVNKYRQRLFELIKYSFPNYDPLGVCYF